MLSYESSEGQLKMTNRHHSKMVCVSSYVSSKNFGERMQIHIGCICLTFLHCVFSNVSSNRLPGQRQNHIGCICLIFLHCAFSNVSSNCLPEQKQTHIGYICLTFRRCAFSNVSLNCLPDRIQSHIDCICLTFLHCVFFHMVPQMAFLGRCIVALITFLRLYNNFSIFLQDFNICTLKNQIIIFKIFINCHCVLCFVQIVS